MKKPVLVIMAAGMGSRYGGLKQIDPMDEHGNLIIDYSIYDAVRAGFEKVVFIIKKENEAEFMEVIGNRIGKQVEAVYAYQDLTDLPEGFFVPEGRKKPWGTGQAVLSCKELVDGPFALINADDFYGAGAFRTIYQFLENSSEEDRFAMVGYVLENTLTDYGHVARGVCVTDAPGRLVEIHERTQIEKKENGAAYTEDGGATWIPIPAGSTVSMNLWGFTPRIFAALEEGFPKFLSENLEKNPLKCEYFLPSAVEALLKEGKASVEVLHSYDRWYGVTYREDKETVVRAIRALKEKGLYPEKLWEQR